MMVKIKLDPEQIDYLKSNLEYFDDASVKAIQAISHEEYIQTDENVIDDMHVVICDLLLKQGIEGDVVTPKGILIESLIDEFYLD